MDESKKNISSRLRFKEMEDISNFYFLALKHISHPEKLKDSGESIGDYELYVARVRRAFHSLDYLDQTIINNEFFYEAYANWWKKLYSRSTFYRLKKKCMFRFLEAFNNEN